MPCESCRVEFTVFRRKRSCFECRRYYCNNCLSPSKRCQRCAIFATRPLLRADLLKLKPKDLIFYLQSKHISTDGCLEKEELVGLVLAQASQMDFDRSSNARNSSDRNQSNTMDSLKQTCQNFFTNLSDNISDSLSSFEPKQTSETAGANRKNSRRSSNETGPSHIFEQPRVSTRQIPTYASAVTGQVPVLQRAPTLPEQVHVHAGNANQTTTINNTPSTSSVEASLNTSASPTAVRERVSYAGHNSRNFVGDSPQSIPSNENIIPDEPCKSDCECSDDEIIATFSARLSLKADNSSHCSHSKPSAETNATGLEASNTTTSTISASSKLGACAADVSSQSSFEELGAIGGVSDESKAATDTNSSNQEPWQLLDVSKNEQSAATRLHSNTPSDNKEILEASTSGERISEPVSTQTVEQHIPSSHANVTQRTKVIKRRRSDGYLNNRHHLSDDESPVAATSNGLSTLCEQPEVVSSLHGSCRRCGKNKTNIKRHVEKMRQHLEDSQMTEEDIKRELQEFLEYLEQRTKSVDCSDVESHAVSPLSPEAISFAGRERGSIMGMFITPTIEFSPTEDDAQWDDDEGIHVYAAPPDFEAATGVDSRFINLVDIEDINDLENLTVKELKEVLMLHRVDYKGCCEKQELLDRVKRLWKNMQSTPAVEKLATDELCKICMDAPIECVFLECGHMATCTNCGKVLNECPICRQYIVRVVRFFRA